MPNEKMLHAKNKSLLSAEEALKRSESRQDFSIKRHLPRLPGQLIGNQVYRKRYELEQESTSFQAASKSASASAIVIKNFSTYSKGEAKKFKIKAIEKIDAKILKNQTHAVPLSKADYKSLKKEKRRRFSDKSKIPSPITTNRIRFHELLTRRHKVKQSVYVTDPKTGEITKETFKAKVNNTPAMHNESFFALNLKSAGSALKFKAKQELMYNEDSNTAAQAAFKSFEVGERTLRKFSRYFKAQKYSHPHKSSKLRKKAAQKRNARKVYKTFRARIGNAVKTTTKRLVIGTAKALSPILIILLLLVIVLVILIQMLGMLFSQTSTAYSAQLAQIYTYSITAADCTDAVNYWGECAEHYMRTFKNIPNVITNDESECEYYSEIRLNALDSYRLAAILSCFFTSDDFQNNIESVYDFISNLFFSQYGIDYSVSEEERTREVTSLVPKSEGEISPPYPDDWVSVNEVTDEDGKEFYKIVKNQTYIYRKLHYEMIYKNDLSQIIENICDATGDLKYIERYNCLMSSYGLLFICSSPLSFRFPTENNMIDEIAFAPGNIVTWADDSALRQNGLIYNAYDDNIYTIIDGTISERGEDYVIINNTNASLYCKISGLADISSAVNVVKGDLIGQCRDNFIAVEIYDINGQYYNPLFLIDNGCVSYFYEQE